MINSFTGRFHFLSNFYPVKIEHNGIKYPSVEHFYVAMKINSDQIINGEYITCIDCREYIAKIGKAGEAKRIGRQLKIRRDWEDVRLGIMDWAVREKFNKNEDLKGMLMATNGEEIVEGNFWHDNFFGSCSCPKCGNTGENHLGKILMKIRLELSQKPELIV